MKIIGRPVGVARRIADIDQRSSAGLQVCWRRGKDGNRPGLHGFAGTVHNLFTPRCQRHSANNAAEIPVLAVTSLLATSDT